MATTAWPLLTPIRYRRVLTGTITAMSGDQRRVSWDETSCAPGDTGASAWLSVADLYANASVPIIKS